MMGQNWGDRASLTGRQAPLPHLKAHKRDNISRSQSRPLPTHRPQGIVTRRAETQRSWGSGSAASRARSPAPPGMRHITSDDWTRSAIPTSTSTPAQNFLAPLKPTR